MPTRGITPRRWERSREPLSRVSTRERSSARASMPSASRRRIAERSATGSAAHAGKAARAARTARSTSSSPPAEISPSSVSSMGETSVNVEADATRSPLIQCRVSTSTPSTSIVLMPILPGHPFDPNDIARTVATLGGRRPASSSAGERGTAVPLHTDLAVVPADDLVHLEARELLRRRLEQAHVDVARPGWPALELRGTRRDQLGVRVGGASADAGVDPVVRHRVGVHEAVGLGLLAQCQHASASRRSPAASVAPNMPPSAICGAPWANGCGRVCHMVPSFFG